MNKALESMEDLVTCPRCIDKQPSVISYCLMEPIKEIVKHPEMTEEEIAKYNQELNDSCRVVDCATCGNVFCGQCLEVPN